MGDSFSLDAKQSSVKVLDRARTIIPRSDTTVPCQNANGVLVDVILEGNWTGTVVLYGNNGSAWLQEADSNASKAINQSQRYVVLNVSQVLAVGITAINGAGEGGITVIITPYIAAAATLVQVQGTSVTDISKYAGVNVGPANALDVKPGAAATFPVSAADGQLATVGATTDAEAAGDGTVIGILKRLRSLLAGILTNQPAPCSWSQVGTSAAAAALTVTQAAAGAGVRNYLSGFTVSWSGGAPANGTKVEVLDDATVIWTGYLGWAAATIGTIHFAFSQPLRSSANKALNIVVDAAGAGITTKVSALGTTGL